MAPNDEHSSFDANGSIDEAMAARRDFDVAQRARLRAHIEETRPELAEAYGREESAFAELADAVLAPALAGLAADAQARGLHMRLVREDEPAGIFGAATPGIRLLVSREPLPDADTIALFGGVSFVGFHGRCPEHVVEVTIELYPSGGSAGVERDERTLDYDTVTVDGVHGLVDDALRRLR
ncbi:hypothetical protein [Methylobacterium radiodurans]|uniref:Uncharacterized protein n=1 Tax=Methylobacterium radiodurans TaxID=2202828 RepID=A0A2U8VN56_9HYPH|nr:hypothetical protein [Methylobacterium radiodurans]AWN35045.1 hypothetical protein DK427_04215 [Methylobacterium radiodurans]